MPLLFFPSSEKESLKNFESEQWKKEPQEPFLHQKNDTILHYFVKGSFFSRVVEGFPKMRIPIEKTHQAPIFWDKNLLLMVQKSGDHQLIWWISHDLHGFSTIPTVVFSPDFFRCQQYPPEV